MYMQITQNLGSSLIRTNYQKHIHSSDKLAFYWKLIAQKSHYAPGNHHAI